MSSSERQKAEARKKFFKNTGSGDDFEKEPVCKHFGCAQILTHREQLFGDFCISHSGKKIETIKLYLQTYEI